MSTDVATAPVSFGQLSVWRTQELTIPVDRWQESNLTYVWPVPPATTVRTLHRELDRLAVRHESLRTSFELTGPAPPRQLVHPPAPVDLAVRRVAAGGGSAAQAEGVGRA